MSARKSYTCWQSTIISDYECSALTWSSARIPPEQYKLDVSFWTIHDRAILWNSNYFSWGWLRYRVSKLSGHQSKNWIELIKEKDCIGVRITNNKQTKTNNNSKSIKKKKREDDSGKIRRINHMEHIPHIEIAQWELTLTQIIKISVAYY